MYTFSIKLLIISLLSASSLLAMETDQSDGNQKSSTTSSRKRKRESDEDNANNEQQSKRICAREPLSAAMETMELQNNIGLFEILPIEILSEIFSYCKLKELMPICSFFKKIAIADKSTLTYKIPDINAYFRKYIDDHQGQPPYIMSHTLGRASPFKNILDLETQYVPLINVEAMAVEYLAYQTSKLDRAYFIDDETGARHLTYSESLDYAEMYGAEDDELIPIMYNFAKRILLSSISSVNIDTESVRYLKSSLKTITALKRSKRQTLTSVKHLTLRGNYCLAETKELIHSLQFIPYLSALQSFTLDVSSLTEDLSELLKSSQDRIAFLQVIADSPTIKHFKIVNEVFQIPVDFYNSMNELHKKSNYTFNLEWSIPNPESEVDL